jgi:hypothetical protein
LRRNGGKRPGNWLAAWVRRAGLWLAAVALLSQSLVAAAPEMHPLDARAAAAQLTAMLGPTVVVCTQADGSDSPTSPPDCRDKCPLCRLAADLGGLDAPVPPGLAARLPVGGNPLPAVPSSRFQATFPGFAFARGPPSLT